MKKLVFIFVVSLVSGAFLMNLSSCKSEKKSETAGDSMTEETSDSLGNDTVSVVDNTPVTDTEKFIDERPIPKAADELFDDFFFTFYNSRKFQKERIQWPLKNVVYGKEQSIKENSWQMEKFYAEDGFYVLLLDNVKQTEIAKDTSINNVVVKHVNIPANALKNYTFNRIEGQWKLTEIEKESLSESKNANFLKFYQRFASDSTYCAESLEEKIKFTGPDIEDENITSTRDIDAAEYFEWAPELLTDFYAITYGQQNSSSNNKVFIMRQPASSQECQLHFRRNGSNWKLYKLQE